MLSESFAILVLSLLMVGILVRSKHVGYAVAIIPVAIIPAAHLLTLAVLYFAQDTIFGVRTAAINGFIDLLALVASIILIVFISQKIQSSKNRKLYLISLSIYTIVLGWVYIWDSLRVIIPNI